MHGPIRQQRAIGDNDAVSARCSQWPLIAKQRRATNDHVHKGLEIGYRPSGSRQVAHGYSWMESSHRPTRV